MVVLVNTINTRKELDLIDSVQSRCKLDKLVFFEATRRVLESPSRVNPSPPDMLGRIRDRLVVPG